MAGYMSAIVHLRLTHRLTAREVFIYDPFDSLLEGVSKLDPEEKNVIKQMVEGIMLKHQAKQLIN